MSKGRGLVPAKHSHEPRQVEQLDNDEGNSEDASRGDTVELPPIMVGPPPSAEAKQDEGPERKPMPKFGADTLYSPENMHVLIFDWLNETFPHPENKMINGAQGGVGSGYFSWCFSELTIYGEKVRADGQRSISRKNRIWCWSSLGSTT